MKTTIGKTTREFIVGRITADSFTRMLGYDDKEVHYIHALVAAFMNQSASNLPQVDVEITSFRIERTDNKLKLTGDMTYNRDNRWLTILVSFSNSVFDISIRDIVFEYLRQVRSEYGLELFEDTSLYQLVTEL